MPCILDKPIDDGSTLKVGLIKLCSTNDQKFIDVEHVCFDGQHNIIKLHKVYLLARRAKAAG